MIDYTGAFFCTGENLHCSAQANVLSPVLWLIWLKNILTFN